MKSSQEQERMIFQSVRDYYSSSDAIDIYTDYARTEGLNDVEQAMIERFMSTPAKILDIGCGAGREAFVLTRMGYSVTGVDITPALLEKARMLAEEFGLQIDFREGDGKTLDFDEGSFNYVLLITQMIHHVPLRKNRVNLLKEAGRVVKRSGRIILTYHDWDILKNHKPWGYGGPIDETAREMMDSYSILEPGDRFGNECQGTLTQVYGFGHTFTRQEMESEVAEAGLKIIERADFYSITGRPLEFWKPTQVLVIGCQA